MTRTDRPQPAPCPASGAHLPPPYLTEALPPVQDSPDLARALTAAWHGCTPCMLTHRATAALDIVLPRQALTLWLIFMAITAHEREIPPPANAQALLESLLTGARPGMSDAARNLLTGLSLTAISTPDGYPAAMWDADQLDDALTLLPSADRAHAWDDSLRYLVGVVKGYEKAHEEGLLP